MAEPPRSPMAYVGFRDKPHADCARINAWLAELTYRPGSTLECRPRAGEQIVLHMSILVFNSYGQAPKVEHDLKMVLPAPDDGGYGPPMRQYLGAMLGDIIRVETSWPVPPYMPDGGKTEFLAWLRRCLHEWECHESDEWLKVKATGLPLNDPHKNDRSFL